MSLLGLEIHGGHGATEPSGIVHYLFEPLHAGALLIGAVFVVALRARAARRER